MMLDDVSIYSALAIAISALSIVISAGNIWLSVRMRRERNKRKS